MQPTRVFSKINPINYKPYRRLRVSRRPRICHSLTMSDFGLSRRRLYPLYATVLRFTYAMADDYAETKREYLKSLVGF